MSLQAPGVNSPREEITLDLTEYQRLRRQLDDELRAGIEMLQTGHRAKVERLDALWRESLAEIPASPPIAPGPPAPAAAEAAPSERRGAGEVRADVEAALVELGDEFLKSDVCRALGYEPHRTSLHRALWELQKDGVIEIQEQGGGRRATRYRKTAGKAQG